MMKRYGSVTGIREQCDPRLHGEIRDMFGFAIDRGIARFRSRSQSRCRRALRNRRQVRLEMLEIRVLPSYTFTFNGTTAATIEQTANSGNGGDSLALIQVPGTGLEHSVNGGAFSPVWTGGTPPNSPAVTVTIDRPPVSRAIRSRLAPPSHR